MIDNKKERLDFAKKILSKQKLTTIEKRSAQLALCDFFWLCAEEIGADFVRGIEALPKYACRFTTVVQKLTMLPTFNEINTKLLFTARGSIGHANNSAMGIGKLRSLLKEAEKLNVFLPNILQEKKECMEQARNDTEFNIDTAIRESISDIRKIIPSTAYHTSAYAPPTPIAEYFELEHQRCVSNRDKFVLLGIIFAYVSNYQNTGSTALRDFNPITDISIGFGYTSPSFFDPLSITYSAQCDFLPKCITDAPREPTSWSYGQTTKKKHKDDPF